MPPRIISVVLILPFLGPPLVAAEPSWTGKAVILTAPRVTLQVRDGEKIAPKTGGVAKDLLFQVVADKDGRLHISSRRQQGWIGKSEAVPFDQAVEFFTKKVSLDPKDGHAFTARGVVLMSKEPYKALADFDKAIQLDSKATLAYYHRANLAYGRGQYDKALADYNTVIRNDPEFDWAYHVRGWIYYRKKDYDKALADYEQREEQKLNYALYLLSNSPRRIFRFFWSVPCA
jgi:tetratricopeptide (TPR) repeat protein